MSNSVPEAPPMPPALSRRLPVRIFVFRLHWLLGISIGLVLAFMGMTGAIMAFEDEIMAALSPQARVEVAAQAPMPPDALLALIRRQLPDDKVTALLVENDPNRAYTVTVLRRPADGGRNPRIFVNPYTGKLLGEATGADFFGRVRSLHRYLTPSGASNEIGRHITGAAAFAAIFFALSGLYLRWPARPLDWRSWLRVDFSMRGRALYRTLHSVIGSWMSLVYVVSALSGLWWSYDWYRSAVTWVLSGETMAVAKPRKANASQKSDGTLRLDGVLAAVRQQYGERLVSVLIVMGQPDKPARARVLTTDSSHDRALDELQIDRASGNILRQDLQADLTPGKWIMANMDPIHTGIAFGPVGRIMVFLAALGLPFFAVTGLLLYAGRRKTASMASSPAIPPYQVGKPGPLIVHASQTGTAERLARQAVLDFRAAGIGARLSSLADMTAGRLQTENTVLFIASTYGDGHPPDGARHFAAKEMTGNTNLSRMRYGLLALGDRRHIEFCAFGAALNAWLRACGAQSLFEHISVDAQNPESLSLWRRQLRIMGAAYDSDNPDEAPFEPWLLERRECLNPGSAGGPVFRIRLAPRSGSPSWRPGDIAEILPGQTAMEQRPDMAPREYSIASIARDGAIVLIVRQIRRADGALGIGSGWLTSEAREGDHILLRIRSNTNFHPPVTDRPMILIGNGTGIAGLHAHLRHRAETGMAENWLFFGERNRETDFLMREEITALQTEGLLQRISAAFSRDQRHRIYVQHRIADETDELKRWVDRGAAIYVCGSSDTMAPAVDAALRAALGASRLNAMSEQGLYRRDIY
ncbi:PepSY domain-containing protein [Brucellaceae bacterium D45D]